MPSVTMSTRVSAVKRRSKRTCQPTSRAERPALFVGDAPGHGPRGDAAWLQHQHAARVDQRRRHARGLARAGRGDQHGGTLLG